MAGMRIGDKEWALAVERRAKAGERVPWLLMRMASEALGRAVERHAPARRPDHADRAAGDDSFKDAPADEEVVPL